MENRESKKMFLLSLIVITLFILFMATNGFGFGYLITGNVIDISRLSIGNSPVLGNPDAPITIYEFSDFSCPYCAKAAETLKEIESQYVSTGKAKIVFKYFPGHGSGRIAHQIAFCLNEQNLFWEFHDLAFANQEDTGDLIKMKALAQTLGADMAKLESCFNSGKYSSQLKEDEDMAKAIGIKGTPVFIINDKIIEGAESYDVFDKAIRKAL